MLDPGRVAGRDLELGLLEERHALRREEPLAADALDRHGDQRTGLDELRVQHLASGRRERQVALQPVDRTDPRRRPQPQLRGSGPTEQTVGSVPRQQLVPERVARRHDLFQELRREQPLGEVVDPAVALAPRDPEGPGLGQRLEDRPDLVGRTPVPLDRVASRDVGRRQRALRPDPVEQLIDERSMFVERGLFVPYPRAVPVDPVPGELGRRDEREALVVRLEEGSLLIEEMVRHLPSVAGHARQEHEVVVPADDVDRVELDRAEPVEHREDAVRPRRERPRRREEVVDREVAAGDLAGDQGRTEIGSPTRAYPSTIASSSSNVRIDPPRSGPPRLAWGSDTWRSHSPSIGRQRPGSVGASAQPDRLRVVGARL